MSLKAETPFSKGPSKPDSTLATSSSFRLNQRFDVRVNAGFLAELEQLADEQPGGVNRHAVRGAHGHLDVFFVSEVVADFSQGCVLVGLEQLTGVTDLAAAQQFLTGDFVRPDIGADVGRIVQGQKPIVSTFDVPVVGGVDGVFAQFIFVVDGLVAVQVLAHDHRGRAVRGRAFDGQFVATGFARHAGADGAVGGIGVARRVGQAALDLHIPFDLFLFQRGFRFVLLGVAEFGINRFLGCGHRRQQKDSGQGRAEGNKSG